MSSKSPSFLQRFRKHKSPSSPSSPSSKSTKNEEALPTIELAYIEGQRTAEREYGKQVKHYGFSTPGSSAKSSPQVSKTTDVFDQSYQAGQNAYNSGYSLPHQTRVVAENSAGQVITTPPKIRYKPVEKDPPGDFTNKKAPVDDSLVNSTDIYTNTNPQYSNEATTKTGTGYFFDPSDTQGGYYGEHSQQPLNESTRAHVEHRPDLKTKPSAYREEDERREAEERRQAEEAALAAKNQPDSAAKEHLHSHPEAELDPEEEHKVNKSVYNAGGVDSAVAGGAGAVAGAAGIGAAGAGALAANDAKNADKDASKSGQLPGDSSRSAGTGIDPNTSASGAQTDYNKYASGSDGSYVEDDGVSTTALKSPASETPNHTARNVGIVGSVAAVAAGAVKKFTGSKTDAPEVDQAYEEGVKSGSYDAGKNSNSEVNPQSFIKDEDSGYFGKTLDPKLETSVDEDAAKSLETPQKSVGDSNPGVLAGAAGAIGAAGAVAAGTLGLSSSKNPEDQTVVDAAYEAGKNKGQQDLKAGTYNLKAYAGDYSSSTKDSGNHNAGVGSVSGADTHSGSVKSDDAASPKSNSSNSGLFAGVGSALGAAAGVIGYQKYKDGKSEDASNTSGAYASDEKTNTANPKSQNDYTADSYNQATNIGTPSSKATDRSVVDAEGVLPQSSTGGSNGTSAKEVSSSVEDPTSKDSSSKSPGIIGGALGGAAVGGAAVLGLAAKPFRKDYDDSDDDRKLGLDDKSGFNEKEYYNSGFKQGAYEAGQAQAALDVSGAKSPASSSSPSVGNSSNLVVEVIGVDDKKTAARLAKKASKELAAQGVDLSSGKLVVNAETKEVYKLEGDFSSKATPVTSPALGKDFAGSKSPEISEDRAKEHLQAAASSNTNQDHHSHAGAAGLGAAGIAAGTAYAGLHKNKGNSKDLSTPEPEVKQYKGDVQPPNFNNADEYPAANVSQGYSEGTFGSTGYDTKRDVSGSSAKNPYSTDGSYDQYGSQYESKDSNESKGKGIAAGAIGATGAALGAIGLSKKSKSPQPQSSDTDASKSLGSGQVSGSKAPDVKPSSPQDSDIVVTVEGLKDEKNAGKIANQVVQSLKSKPTVLARVKEIKIDAASGVVRDENGSIILDNLGIAHATTGIPAGGVSGSAIPGNGQGQSKSGQSYGSPNDSSFNSQPKSSVQDAGSPHDSKLPAGAVAAGVGAAGVGAGAAYSSKHTSNSKDASGYSSGAGGVQQSDSLKERVSSEKYPTANLHKDRALDAYGSAIKGGDSYQSAKPQKGGSSGGILAAAAAAVGIGGYAAHKHSKNQETGSTGITGNDKEALVDNGLYSDTADGSKTSHSSTTPFLTNKGASANVTQPLTPLEPSNPVELGDNSGYTSTSDSKAAGAAGVGAAGVGAAGAAAGTSRGVDTSTKGAAGSSTSSSKDEVAKIIGAAGAAGVVAGAAAASKGSSSGSKESSSLGTEDPKSSNTGTKAAVGGGLLGGVLGGSIFKSRLKKDGSSEKSVDSDKLGSPDTKVSDIYNSNSSSTSVEDDAKLAGSTYGYASTGGKANPSTLSGSVPRSINSIDLEVVGAPSDVQARLHKEKLAYLQDHMELVPANTRKIVFDAKTGIAYDGIGNQISELSTLRSYSIDQKLQEDQLKIPGSFFY